MSDSLLVICVVGSPDAEPIGVDAFEMGATAMTITHDMTSVRAIADNVAMLHNGVIQWTGPVADMDISGDPYLEQFITGSAEGPIEAVR